jgi:hypothetical protein
MSRLTAFGKHVRCLLTNKAGDGLFPMIPGGSRIKTKPLGGRGGLVGDRAIV